MTRRQGEGLEIVRLRREGSAKPAAKVRNAPAVRKLVIRLLPGINEHLRTAMRYRGDLSAMIIEAINTVDLQSVRVVELASDSRLRTTTVGLPPSIHESLSAVAKLRNASMNIMVNTALAHWLAGKKVIRLV
ncbi:MAG TPA: hypothetical protein VE398_17160 [Acidobacteriota bacterium]|nr:hypothetical protein [Acidobacteriota bacterium]